MSKEINEAALESTEIKTISWEEAIAAKAAEQAATKAALNTGPSFVSFKGGHITVDGVAIPGDTLDIVVLTFIAENTWYKGKFDPTVPQTPACYAVYNKPEDMWASDDIEDRQSDECHSCPKFQWGSDPQGGKGKACKTRYRLAVIPAPGPNSAPNTVLGADLRMLVLPVTSGKAFDQACSKARLLYSRPIFGVVSKLTIVPDAKTQYQVKLEPVDAIDGALMMAVLSKIDLAEKEITYDYGFEDGSTADEPKGEAKPLK